MDWQETLYRWEEYAEKLYPLRYEVAHVFETKYFYCDFVKLHIEVLSHRAELAEVRGKRLLIASELDEGARLNTAVVKNLCSTDNIQAEKKFKAPFSFTPSHTLVLYTNHLPKIGTTDEGTWRRIILVPFNAQISHDIKNYPD